MGDGCKVDDTVETYGLSPQSDEFGDIHENLLALWKGTDGNEGHGYRQVTEWFNKRLLKHVYDEAGRVTIGSRLDNEFATITGDDEIAREELLDDLEFDGIDGEALVANMVSWSTMRRHLVECLDGEKKRQSADTDWEQNSVEIATEQLVEKVEKALSSHESKGTISGATSADIAVQIQLSCPECPTRRSLADALKIGYVCEDHCGPDR